MVSRSLIRQFDVFADDIEAELGAAFEGTDDWLPADSQIFTDNKIVSGKIRKVTAESVWVDVGFKSEGVVELREWYDDDTGKIIPPSPGDVVEVLLEAVEDGNGGVVLSYRKAKRQKAWDQIISTHKDGDVVSGVVTRKIKGGLLVNIGVNVFLPASQVDVRRPSDIGDFIGKTIECKIMIIDHDRRNIVVSRRRLIEDQRVAMKSKVLAEIEPGQIRWGVVKNIASFGAFVDLGGIDGLLHVTDMAWHRVEKPEEIVRIDEKIEVFIIKVDKNTEKISLGIKQKTASPWAGVADRYTIGSRHKGEVVNVMTYGAFVKLEPGIEGLVHISEMSWTRRISHPSEVVKAGDAIEVEILNINQEKQEISLGIKQTHENPWDKVAEKYPAGTQVEGIVRNLTNYGAFIEIEEGVDGLLHVSDMSWVRKIAHPKDGVTKGEKLKCVVLDVDPERRRIGLGLKQMVTDPWATDIPARFQVGELKTGTVTKVTNFGVFVELEPGLEGLLHISELNGNSPEGTPPKVEVGDSIEVRILRVEVEERKLALSGKTSEIPTATSDKPASPARASNPNLRGGIGADSDLLVDLGNGSVKVDN
ncbi:MAG: 30S ribosomal protein S1 [Planctomycetota bacterium]|jgi:small subunit ribosomal protein S1